MSVTKKARYSATTDLLGQLVPGNPPTDGRPRFPLQRLRRLDQGLLDGGHPAANLRGSVRWQDRVDVRHQPGEVVRECRVPAPIATGDLYQATEVDEVTGPSTDLMLEQQRLRIDDVFGVDLDDLQLGQQQVSRRQGLRMQLEAIVELERVTHAESPDENIDLALVALVIEEQAAVAVQVIEAPVGNIAEVLQQTLESPVLPLLHHDIDVAVPPLECRWEWTVPVHAHGGATQQAHQDLRLRRSLEKTSRFGFDIREWCLFLDHSGHLIPQAGRPRVAR